MEARSQMMSYKQSFLSRDLPTALGELGAAFADLAEAAEAGCDTKAATQRFRSSMSLVETQARVARTLGVRMEASGRSVDVHARSPSEPLMLVR